MAARAELKSCPFCGGAGTEIGHIVHCQECMATAHGDGWNERVEEDTNEVIAVQLLLADGQTLTLPANIDEEKFERTLKTMLNVKDDSGEVTDLNIMTDPPPKKASIEDMKAEDPAGEVGPKMPLKKDAPPPITKPNGMQVKTKRKTQTKANGAPPLKHTLSDWIDKEGITVVKAARMTDLSEPTIYNLLNGSKPSPNTLEKLAGVVPGVEV